MHIPAHELARLEDEMLEMSDFRLGLYAEDGEKLRQNDWELSVGRKTWRDLTIEEKRALRASNVIAKKKRLAKQQAEADEKDTQRHTEAKATFDRDLEEYRKQVEREFREQGADTHFTALWPELERQWVAKRTKTLLNEEDALVETLRRNPHKYSRY